MIVFVIVLAALAAVLLVLLLTTRRRLGAERVRATRAEERAAGELTAAGEARDRAEQARADADERANAAEARCTEFEDQVRMVDGRASAAESRATAAEAERDEARREAESAAASRLETEARVAALEQRAADAAAALAAAAEAAESATATAPAVTGELDAQLVWALEKARSERTWRHSVAVGPGGSAFAEASDPLSDALQIELDAAREEVGAVIELDAELPAGVTASGALLTLRVAQELLADVVRRGDSTTVRVRADGADLLVDVDSRDEDGNRLETGPLPAPPSPAIETTPTGVRIRNAVAPPSPD